MKTTDCQITFMDQPTQVDAFGNNVAWKCIECDHPVLFVCLVNQKGFDGKATHCLGCNLAYTIYPKNDNALLIEIIQ